MPSRNRIAAGAALSGALLLLLAAWLSLPRAKDDGAQAPAVRVVLVDASASVLRQRPGWLTWARAALGAEAAEAARSGEEVAVVVFAEEVRLGFGPGAPAALDDLLAGRGGAPLDPREGAGGDGASPLAAALEVASGLVRERGRAPGRLVLLGEGAYTGEDPAAALASLAAAGVAVERRVPPPPSRGDLALRELYLPRRVEAGAPLVARVRLAWSPGRAIETEALLRARIASGDVERTVERPLALAPGGGTWEVALDCGPAGFGRTDVEVRVRLAAEADPVPENDEARASTLAGGERVVGLVAGEDSGAEARARLLPSGTSALPGLQFLPLEIAELAPALVDLDALVTWDVPLEALPVKGIERFVAGGGGWLVVSGWGLLEGWVPGVHGDGGLEELLPLEPAPLDPGPRDVILLVDGSGSMAGEPFETVRMAALDLVAAALPSDRVSLRFFTTNLEPEELLRARSTPGGPSGASARAGAARALLSARVPTGPTYILRTLEQLALEREESGGETLVLLLTDGRERDVRVDPSGAAAAVTGRLRAAGVRLAVIAVGAAPDLAFLALLTGGDEPPARAEDLEDLRAVFRREVGGARWREAQTPGGIPLVRAPVPDGSLAAEVAAADAPPPPLARTIRNRLRPGGELVWSTDQGEPVLAVQRVAQGRTALFSAQPSPDWAPAWGRGAAAARRLGPLLRWLARRPRAPDEARLSVSVEGERLVVEGFRPGEPALVEARLVADTGGGGAEDELAVLPLALPSSASGADPRAVRAAPLPPDLRQELALPGRFLLLPGVGGADPGAPVALPVGPEPSPEFAGAEGRLSDALFGPAGALPGAAAGSAGPDGGAPAAPWAAGAALACLLVAAVAGRGAAR